MAAPRCRLRAQTPTPIWQFDWVNLARTVAGHTIDPAAGAVHRAAAACPVVPDDGQVWVCTGERGVLHYQHDQWQREIRLPEQALIAGAGCDGQLLLGYADGRRAAWVRMAPRASTPGTACR